MHTPFCDIPIQTLLPALTQFGREYEEGPQRDAYMRNRYGGIAMIWVTNGIVSGSSLAFACRTLKIDAERFFAALRRATIKAVNPSEAAGEASG